MYFNGSYSVTRAVDAKTGKVLWEFDPKVIERNGDLFANLHNPGIENTAGRHLFSAVDEARPNTIEIASP